jgi:hypothetical protein
MSVVLRCSSCGTTQSRPGECEACHEAQVRYFCTNHEPGIWLEAASCPQCGARFGVAARPVAAPIPTRARRRPPTPVRAPRPVSAPPASYAEPVMPSEPAPGLPPGALWQALLRAALSSRDAPLFRSSRRGAGLGGCVMRLLWVAVLGFLALLAALFFFGRSLLY